MAFFLAPTAHCRQMRKKFHFEYSFRDLHAPKTRRAQHHSACRAAPATFHSFHPAGHKVTCRLKEALHCCAKLHYRQVGSAAPSVMNHFITQITATTAAMTWALR